MPATGWYHSLGLKIDGSIVAWGQNGNGQCNVPAPNARFAAIAAGGAHSLARKIWAPGDANCDRLVTWRDIAYFRAALNDQVSAWTALFSPNAPTCPFANNDVGGRVGKFVRDGHVDWRDINGFVALMNTTCP